MKLGYKCAYWISGLIKIAIHKIVFKFCWSHVYFMILALNGEMLVILRVYCAMQLRFLFFSEFNIVFWKTFKRKTQKT